MSVAERRRRRIARPAFWSQRAENTLDRATAMMGGPDEFIEFIEEEGLMQVARVHIAAMFDYLGVA